MRAPSLALVGGFKDGHRVLQRDLGLVVQRGAVVARLLGHGGQVVARHAQLGQRERHAVLAVEQVVQGGQLVEERAIERFRRRAGAQGRGASGREDVQQLAVESGVDASIQVEPHAVGEQHHHGLAVRDAAEAAQRVADGVHDAHHGVRERRARHKRSQRQAGARFGVGAVAAGRGQVRRDQLDRLRGERVGHGVLLDGRVRLDGVGERVHAGGGRQLRRQRRGERGVEDGHVRHQLVRGERQLRMLVRVGHHGDQRHLAAGAGRRGHGDERRQVGLQNLRALQRGEVHALAGQRRGRALRRIDDRAAADGHEPVAAAFGVQARHLVYHVHRRVGRHLVEHLVGHVGGIQHAGQLRGHAQLHEARVGHHQRVLHAAVGHLVGQLVQRMRATDDFRGATEFESLHGLLLAGWIALGARGGRCERLRRAVRGAPTEEQLQQRREHIGEGHARVVGPARGERTLRERRLQRHAAGEAGERIGQRPERDDVVDGEGLRVGAGQAAAGLHVRGDGGGRNALERAGCGAAACARQIRPVHG